MMAEIKSFLQNSPDSQSLDQSTLTRHMSNVILRWLSVFGIGSSDFHNLMWDSQNNIPKNFFLLKSFLIS